MPYEGGGHYIHNNFNDLNVIPYTMKVSKQKFCGFRGFIQVSTTFL